MKILNDIICNNFIELAVTRTANYLIENNLSGISLGISGGIDSSVVALIGLKAIDELKKSNKKIGYEFMFLDCDSDPFDYKRAKILAKKFNFELKYLNLNNWYWESPLHKLIPQNHPRRKYAEGNIKCRLRMISLYNSTQLHNYVYLDTDDLSEEYMGFWTRHGDEGDVKIIQHLTKTEVYDLGKYMGIPTIIINSQHGDGLKVTSANTSVDQLGLNYIYIEYIISRFIGEKFDFNGKLEQLNDHKYKKLITCVSQEITIPEENVIKVLNQSLKTAYKRKYGDSVVHLLPERREFGLFDIGTGDFNQKYLDVIRSLSRNNVI
jgi:NAD+ synthase